MKNKKLIIIIPIVIALIVFIGVYFYYYREDGNSLNVTDKRWIEENVKSLIDIELPNDYPVYGEQKGVMQNFISSFETASKIEFNKISYSKEGVASTNGLRFRVLNNDEELTDKDLLVNEDVYVLVGLENKKIDSIIDLKNTKLGVLSSDIGEASYYFSNVENITYKKYDDSNSLFQALNTKQVDMIIIPNLMYINKTFPGDDYHIIYTVSEMSKKIVLTLSDKDSRLNDITEKYFNSWKRNSFVEVYNDALFNYYITTKEISDSTTAKLQAKTYKYGYVENYPYEVKKKKSLVGICGEYISRINRLTGIDFEFIKYDSVEDLLKAVENKEVDIYFNYYDVANENYNELSSPFVEKYTVISRISDSNVVTSFESLKGKKISMIGNTALFNYFKDNSKANINEYKDINELLSKGKDNIIVVDSEVYTYYRNSKFKDYEALYSDYITKDYAFMVKDGETIFSDIFNYLIASNSYYRYRNIGINEINNKNDIEAESFEQLYIIILVIILIPVIILITLITLLKRKKVVKKVKKEERRKYIDNLTSLKNRSYLNFNIENWNKSEKYPQSVVVVDLNNVKYVNDNYGHEAGDNLIVQAASTLLNTQLENSELIRTDGNEFLIYLVGYSEKQIEIYTKKLTKELKELPYGFGAAIGYSIIKDGMKTIDDAINEATLEMRTNKEDYK